MSKARIVHELHDDFGVPISEAEKAYDIALEYLRLRSAIGDHPEDYEPSEYVLVKASAQPDLSGYSDRLWRNAYERGKRDAQAEIIRCKDCKHRMPYDWMFSEIWQSQNMDYYPEDEIGCAYCDMSMTANDFCSRAERRQDD